MAKISIFNIPYSGHLNPTLEVTTQLVKKGHIVEYWTTAAIQEKIAKTGARLRIYPDHIHFPEGAANLFSLTAALATAAAQLHPYLLEELRTNPPDVILTDSSTVWGSYLGLELDIPVVTLFPNLVISPKLLLGPWQTRQKLIYDSLKSLPSAFTAITKSYAYTQSAHPYNQGEILDIIASSSDTNIVFTSATFQPEADRLKDKYHFVGPQLPKLTSSSQRASSKTSRKQIYISLGTLYNNNLRFYQNCLSALHQLPLEVIISAGSDQTTTLLQKYVDDLNRTPLKNSATFTIKKSVDQLAVLNSCDLFITHGGMNSVSEAISLGVPMLVVPQTIEQSCNGVRCQQLNLGEYIHNSWASASKIKSIVQKMSTQLDSYHQPLQKISTSFAEAGGTAAAVKIIEQTISQHQHPKRQPSIMLFHGYGTNITSGFTKPRGKTAGFYAFSHLLKNNKATLFRWDIPFNLMFPHSFNPLALLDIYIQEKQQLDSPSLLEKINQQIKNQKTEILIAHSLGSALLLKYLQQKKLPTSVRRIITIQSDISYQSSLPALILNRLQKGSLVWENYWCWWDQALIVSSILNTDLRAGLIGLKKPFIKNKFFPLYRGANLHISSITDPEFVKRLKV